MTDDRQLVNSPRATHAGIKVLFTTGYAENALMNHGHLDRTMQMMTKPFVIEELAAKVGTMLATAEYCTLEKEIERR